MPQKISKTFSVKGNFNIFFRTPLYSRFLFYIMTPKKKKKKEVPTKVTMDTNEGETRHCDQI